MTSPPTDSRRATGPEGPETEAPLPGAMPGAMPGVMPGAMPDRLPENAPAADFDAKSAAKILLRSARAGALATIDRNTGHPFASLVNVATDSDGSPLILVSRLSTHTANLEADSRASILLALTGKGDPLAHPRLTVLGSFAPIAREDANEPRLRRRFLAHHPKAELYAGFADFAFWRLLIASAHLNAGFARAADLKASDVITEISDAQAIIDAEPSAIAHMNEDHADAVQLYATELLGAEAGPLHGPLPGPLPGPWPGPWRVSGLDPDGVDLARGDLVLRLTFRQRVTSPAQLREALADLAKQARSR